MVNFRLTLFGKAKTAFNQIHSHYDIYCVTPPVMYSEVVVI